MTHHSHVGIRTEFTVVPASVASFQIIRYYSQTTLPSRPVDINALNFWNLGQVYSTF